VTIKSHEFKPANLRGTTNIKNDIRSHVDDIYEFQSNMPPTALADSFDVRPSGDNKAMIQEPENMETNHDLTTRTSEERHDHAEKDDAATTAASEELKHTTISDKVHDASAEDMAVAVAESVVEDKDMEGAPKRHTPEPDTSDIQDEEMRERISSPKKKRGRDLDDEARDVESADPDDTASSADGIVNGSRTIRSGPEKKRPRDTSIGPTKSSEKATDVKVSFVLYSVSQCLLTTFDRKMQVSMLQIRLNPLLQTPTHLKNPPPPPRNLYLAVPLLNNQKPQPPPLQVLDLLLWHPPAPRLAV